MTQAVKLALSYQKRHKKQFITSTLCIAFFIAAMLSMQLFQACFADWQQKLRAERYGTFSFVVANTDLSKVDKSVLKEEGMVGLMAATNAIDCPGISSHMIPYLGFMEEECVAMLSAQMVEGNWPTAQGQVAIEQTAYHTLGLTAKVGEEVTLPVIVDGQTVGQTFRLTGIISPYQKTWQNARGDIAERIPTAVTVPGTGTLPNGHVLFENISRNPWPEGMFEGTMSQNVFYLNENGHDGGQLQLLGNVLTGLFVFLLIVGIVNVVNATLADRSRYTGLLRCIGATRKQAFQVFFIQGVLLTATALLLGYGLGLLLLGTAVMVFRTVGFDFSFVLIPLPFVIITALSLGAIFIPYLVQIRRFLQGEPLRLGDAQIHRRNRRMGKGDFSALWFRAKKPALRMQNLLTVLLAGGCMVLLAFGPFYADFVAYGSYAGQESEMDNLGISYWVGLEAGGNDIDNLLIEIPRNKGVPGASVKALQENPNLKVDFSAITTNAAAYLLTADQDMVSPAGKLRAEWSVLRSVPEESKERYFTDLGYPAGSDVLKYPIYGISGDQVAALEHRKISGDFDKDAYHNGVQAVAVGNDFKVGDELTVSIAAYPVDFPLNNEDDRKPDIHNFTVTVGAVYQLDGNGTAGEKRLLGTNEQMLLISDNVLLQYDPAGNYDDICISLVNAPLSSAQQAEVDALIEEIQMNSRQVTVWDRAVMDQEKAQLVWQLKLPYLFMIVLFLISVMTALFLTTSLKVKSNIKSFALLRAIGLDEKQLSYLLFYSNFRPCLLGMGIGTVIGLGLSLLLQAQVHVNGTSYFMQSSLPAVLIGSVLIMLFCGVACLYPKKWMMSKGIISSLQNTAY